jgi:GGDEF domain-containing protein
MIARVGRLLGSGGAGWDLLVGVIEIAISGTPGPSGAPDGILVSAAGALRANLRFDDPVARVGGATFVFAVPFLPGSTPASQVAEHLRAAVAAAVTGRRDGTDGHGPDAPGPDAAGPCAPGPCAPGPDAADGPAGAGRGHEASRAAAGPVVRLATVVCSLPSTDEADGLLRRAVLALRARGCGE